MPEAQQQVVPEDESFLSDEDLFAQAAEELGGKGYKEEAPPTKQETREGDAEQQPEKLQEGESETREAAEKQGDTQNDAGEDEPEWLKDLSEDVKKEYYAQQQELSSLRQQYNSVHNRLAPVQQENARLRQQLSASQPSPAKNSGQAPVGQSQHESKFSLDDIAEFKEYRETYPDEAKAIEAAFVRQSQHYDHLRDQLALVQKGVQDMQQSSSVAKRETELARLSGAHPDWATVRPSEDFNNWLQAQPPAIAQFANSQVADDCIWLLDRYKADAYMAQQFAQNHGQQQPQQPQSDGRAQQTRERRQQIRSVPGGNPQQDGGVGAPQAGGQQQSEEDIWVDEVRRRMQAQREANR